MRCCCSLFVVCCFSVAGRCLFIALLCFGVAVCSLFAFGCWLLLVVAVCCVLCVVCGMLFVMCCVCCYLFVVSPLSSVACYFMFVVV